MGIPRCVHYTSAAIGVFHLGRCSRSEFYLFNMALSPYIAKLEESVDKISWANHEMKTTLEKTLGHIKDEAKKTTKDDVVKASIELLKKMVESIDKFQSGDIVDVINGIFDIVNGILAFASFPGPEGTVIAAIAGPLLSLIGSILSLCFGNKTESQEHMLHRIVTECLKVQTDQGPLIYIT